MATTDTYGYIYLVQTPQFKSTSIFKIGRTEYESFKRFNGYPKGTIIYIIIGVNNHKSAESTLIKTFRSIFKQHYAGNEYFKGNIKIMSRYIWDYYESHIDCTDAIEVKDDISGLVSTFNQIKVIYHRLISLEPTYSLFMSNVKVKHNIHWLGVNSIDIEYRETIELDKYLVTIEREYKTSKKTKSIVYLYNLRDVISSAIGHLMMYEKELSKFSDKYLKFTYKIARDNNHKDYIRSINKCDDIESYPQYEAHWRIDN